MPGPPIPGGEPVAVDPATRTVRWYLESLVEGGRQLRRIGVHPLPFRVGRLAGLGLSLSSESVSKEHAELAGPATARCACATSGARTARS